MGKSVDISLAALRTVGASLGVFDVLATEVD